MQSIHEDETLQLIVQATDFDGANEAIEYSLRGAPPTGLFLDTITGELSWAPGELFGPGAYDFTVRATDEGEPPEFSEVQITVNVLERNTAPTFLDVSDFQLSAGTEFSLQLEAIDSDFPDNTLSYALLSGPEGMLLDSLTGEIKWTVQTTQQPETHQISVRVSDDGSPSLSGEIEFSIQIEPLDLRIEEGDSGVDIGFNTATSKSYLVEYSADMSEGSWKLVGSDVGVKGERFVITDTDAENIRQRFYRLLIYEILPEPELFLDLAQSSSNTASNLFTISGNSLPGAMITISGGLTNLVLTADVNGSFSGEVTLKPNQLNRIFATASLDGEALGILEPQNITQDSEKPFVFIDFPETGVEQTDDTVVVAGRVGDMLSGHLGLDVDVINASLESEATAANVIIGNGQNGTFDRGGVPLQLGENIIRATVRDALGNEFTTEVTLTRINLSGSRMAVISGDQQQAIIQERVSAPLVVQVTREDGSPIQGKIVKYEVIRSDGQLGSDPTNTLDVESELQAITDENGQASAYWWLGSDAGCGNNRIRVTSRDISGSIYFCASANPNTAKEIDIATGNLQKGPSGAQTIEPLRVWVSDTRNGVGGVPVTFTVTQGGGLVNEAQSVTVLSEQTGYASVDYRFGNGGNDIITADIPGNLGSPASFNLISVAPVVDGNTSFRGLVLNNAKQPLGGAPCWLIMEGVIVAQTTSNAEGFFLLENLQPGIGHLHIEGFDANLESGVSIPTGSYPHLAFEVSVVEGAENELPTPVLLPPLNPNNNVLYDGTKDIVLCVEEIDGLKMHVKAGSVTRADGSVPTPQDPMYLSLNQVHFDEIPMPLPDGAAPPFAWTLQPGGTRFNPPVSIEYPNMSALPPGTIDVFFNFDHAAERFNIVATGMVTADGSKLVSDPGVGITVAGWGGGGAIFVSPPRVIADILGLLGDLLDFLDGDDDDGPNGNPPNANGAPETPGLAGAGSNDDPDGKPAEEGTAGDPVLLSSGEFLMSETDLSIPGRGFDFMLKRTYRSRFNYNGVLGNNWDHVYNKRFILTDGLLAQPHPFYQSEVFSGDWINNATIAALFENSGISAIQSGNLPAAPGVRLESIALCNGFSRIDTFEFDPTTGIYTAPEGYFEELYVNPLGFVERDELVALALSLNLDISAVNLDLADTRSAFILRNRSGFETHFNRDGLMSMQVDRNGNRMEFLYDPQDRLTSVIDTLGREIAFRYNAKNRLKTVTDFTGRQVIYQYDDNGDLITVRTPVVTGTSTGNDFPDGKTIAYEYSSGFDEIADPQNAYLNHNLTSVTDGKGQKYLINVYETDLNSYEFDRVVEQQWGDATQLCFFEYSPLNETSTSLDPNEPRSQTIKIDRNGNRRVTTQNRFGQPLQERIETNRNINPNDPPEFVTIHTYNDNGHRASTTFPEGNSISWVYDFSNPNRLQQANLLEVTQTPGPRGADQASTKMSYSYEPIYNQLASRTEARGLDPSYVPQNGGAQSQARYTTNYFYDYQEGSKLSALALELRKTQGEVQSLLTASGTVTGLGDLNEDGITTRTAGNLIQIKRPTVNLLEGSYQSSIEGDTTQEIITSIQYNRFGQKTADIDTEGHVDIYAYFAERDPDGDGLGSNSPRILAQNGGGYLASITRDAETSVRRRSTEPLTQIQVQTFYDRVGNVIRVIDGRGNDTRFEVNALNQIVRKTSSAPFNYFESFEYDGNNNLVKHEQENRDTNGPGLDSAVTTTYEYDILDFPRFIHREVSSSKILTTEYRYDKNQNMVELVQPEGNIIKTLYDERDLPYQITRGFGDAKASTTTQTFDGNKNLRFQTDAQDNNGDGQPETTELIYDGFDRLVTAIDAAGNKTEQIFDPANNVIRIQRFGLDGGATPTDNSGTGNVLLSDQELLFDEAGRVFQLDAHLFANTATVGPEGSLSPGDNKVTARFEYDRHHRSTHVIDDNENLTRKEYDGVDRTVRTIDALGNEVEFAFDANSNVTTITETEISPEGLVPDEVFTTQRIYDEVNRLTDQYDNLLNRTQYGYDSRNNVTLISDALGNRTIQNFDAQNRILNEVQELRTGGTGSGGVDTSNADNPDGLITKTFVWDDNSRLFSETDDNGNPTTYGYDALNRRESETYADGTSKLFKYDFDHNLSRYTDQNGSFCDYTHDAINRITQKDITRAPGVEGVTLQTFEYDGLSRRTSMSDNNNPSTSADDSLVDFHYDSLSRLLIEEQNGKTVMSVFDGVGRRLSCTYPNGRKIEQTHDANNRVKTIANQSAATNIAEYDYLGRYRVLERRYGNGTALSYHDGTGVNTGYDAMRRIINHTHINNADAIFEGFAYAYDKTHNRRFEQNLTTGTADTYEYDSAYRLSRAGYNVNAGNIAGIINNDTTNADVETLGQNDDQLWSLDGVGNWTLLDEGATTAFVPNVMNEYEFVGGAAQTHDDNGNLSSDGSLKFYHDHLNRLVRVTTTSDVPVAEYKYDAAGRRIQKILTGGAEEHYYYDGHQCIEERNETDTLLRQFVFGNGIDEVLELKNSSSNTFYYHDNSISSVAAITDNTGTVVERYSYDAYGETSIEDTLGNPISVSLVGNPFGFTGRRIDTETGLYFYRARYYNPETGRFLQRDPLGYVDGMGLYAYVRNNPVNWFDPFGEKGSGDESPTNDSTKPVEKMGEEELWEELRELEKSGSDPGRAEELSKEILKRQGINPVDFESYIPGGLLAKLLSKLGIKGFKELIKKLLKKKSGAKDDNVSDAADNLTDAQAASKKRFDKKKPSNSSETEVHDLPNDGKAFKAKSKGQESGSAVYEKQVDSSGNTQQFTKTTYDDNGNILHVKDKLTSETY